jgi:hypothetical protein
VSSHTCPPPSPLPDSRLTRTVGGLGRRHRRPLRPDPPVFLATEPKEEDEVAVWHLGPCPFL